MLVMESGESERSEDGEGNRDSASELGINVVLNHLSLYGDVSKEIIK